MLDTTHHRQLVSDLSHALGLAAQRVDLGSTVASAAWPTVGATIRHVGGIYRWCAEVVTTGSRAERRDDVPVSDGELAEWFVVGRLELLAALESTDPRRECWTPSNPAGRAAFWSRRMVYETTKHLIDVRGSGGRALRPLAELDPVDYADGIDELCEVFLSRSRPSLAPLAAPLVLRAQDIERRWAFDESWGVSESHPDNATVVTADCGDLALFVWERASAADSPDRFVIEGSLDVVRQFEAAPIHP